MEKFITHHIQILAYVINFIAYDFKKFTFAGVPHMASRGVNKVILIGNLGQDPEIRYMPSGGAVANLTLATSESWRDKQTGEMKEKTEWHRVVIFGKLAEIAGEYLRKVHKFILKVNYKHVNGKIKVVKIATALKLW